MKNIKKKLYTGTGGNNEGLNIKIVMGLPKAI